MFIDPTTTIILLRAMAIIGRVLGLAFDAVLVSTVLAGVRRTSGFASVPTLLDFTLLNSSTTGQTLI